MSKKRKNATAAWLCQINIRFYTKSELKKMALIVQQSKACCTKNVSMFLNKGHYEISWKHMEKGNGKA